MNTASISINNDFFPRNAIMINNNYFKNYTIPGHFKYINKNNEVKQVCISKVLYNNPVVVVFWDDGTKTVAKCDILDNFNPETGFALCIAKKLYGASYMKDVLKTWVPCCVDRGWVTLKDARKKQ